jgi:hypothetical protein
MEPVPPILMLFLVPGDSKLEAAMTVLPVVLTVQLLPTLGLAYLITAATERKWDEVFSKV